MGSRYYESVFSDEEEKARRKVDKIRKELQIEKYI